MSSSSRVRPALRIEAESIRAGECLELRPILDSTLPEVAAFLHRSRIDRALRTSVGSRKPVSECPLGIERRLKWLLVENPVARDRSPLGCCVVDRNETIRGINLFFPSAFLAADKRIYGLCSGSWFVAPLAQSMGFYLFKKYLHTPGYAFYFATTCNGNSEPVWRMMGGRAVPNSETEYIFPFRLDAMIPAFVGARTSSEIAAGIARMAGWANPLLRFLARRPAALTIEPCRDWEKLSALFRRSRSINGIVSDRSAEFLQWRYGPASPVYPCGIYVFRDRQGNEGWFSLGNLVRGGVQGAFLLDVVWPRDKMSFRDIFREMLHVARQGADAFFFRRQPGLDYREYCPWAVPHDLGARTFVIGPKGSPLIPLDSFDYDDNDYVAWMFHWANADEIRGSLFSYGV